MHLIHDFILIFLTFLFYVSDLFRACSFSCVFIEVKCLSVAYLKPIWLTTFEILAFSLSLYSFTVMCLDMNISFF